ncbi:hypothetical protein [Actinoplanes subglobosus]|uniref:Uncharacterized protein n=1 Tax=Actinoplanes subglobosus TaxID=1547892 RepID=A0ABV8IQS3_9ACTN
MDAPEPKTTIVEPTFEARFLLVPRTDTPKTVVPNRTSQVPVLANG